MPRVATGQHALDQVPGVRLSKIWSSSRQFRLALIDVQEPLCRLLRQLRTARGLICQDPVLMIDRQQFLYGWDVYHVDA